MPTPAREQRTRPRSRVRRRRRATRLTPAAAPLDCERERPLTTLRSIIPLSARDRLRPLLRARPRWGNLRRRSPFSERYGYDRGTPVDRYFIAQFLERHREDVRGAVAEIKDSKYTVAFGGDRVQERHVIDLDAANPAATLVADLAEPGASPRQMFDCFILAQTIQYVADPAAALANAYRSLRPGGSLLLTVPSLARIDPDLGGDDLWRFTPAGLSQLVASSCAGAQVDVSAYGNLVTAVAFLEGLAAEELTTDELDHCDSSFVVLSCARVVAPS